MMWTSPGFEPLHGEALRVRRIRSGVFIVIAAIALIAIDLGLRLLLETTPSIPPFVIPLVFTVVLVAAWWPWTRLSWAAWGWRLDDATFQTRSGVYTKVWKGVPRDRVQFVEVNSGPLQRSAGLATLIVRTAGVRTPAVRVEDLETEVAEHLRSELSPQASEDLSRGLGPDPLA